MTKKLLAALLFATPFFSFSQSLTANEFPLVDDSLVFVNGDTAAFAVPTFGSGQTWDLSGSAFAGGKALVLFLDPSKTTNGSKFTGSNIAEQNGSGATKTTTYYTRNSNSLTIVGAEQGTGTFLQTLPYSDNEKLMDFPFASGNSKYDSYSTQTSGPFGSTNYRNGEVNTYFRGTGTLKLPGMTYNSAILIEIETQQVDSNKSIAGTFTTADYLERRFLWWVSGTRGWVMETGRRDNSSIAGVVVTKTMRMKEVKTSGVGISTMNQTNLSLYPNPVGDNAILSFNSIIPTKVYIYDVCGKECMSISAKSLGQQQLDLPIHNLGAGIYFIRVNESCLRFVKQ